MRHTVQRQLSLSPACVDHVHARELEEIDRVLDALPNAVALIHADLLVLDGERIDAECGRDAMTSEQVLRALVVKQMRSFSYQELSFHLADSITYRWFCRIGMDRDPPSKSTLQRNVKRVQVKTWRAINQMLIAYAEATGIERGEKVRSDCTVVKSNIHHPTDSRLLWDCVRTLVRLMKQAKEEFGLKFRNHARRAKRRAHGISNAKSKNRAPLYRDLIHVTEATIAESTRIADELGGIESMTSIGAARVRGLSSSLRHYLKLTKRVIDQTQRRVFGGESVPATEKVVSIFQPHTDIIIKDQRETFYGHKICLTTGASGLVTDVVVEKGNPCDSTLAVRMIKRQRKIYGKIPRQATFDGGFASQANLAAIKKLGVEDVAFAKRCGLQIADMVKDTVVYRMLKNFRAGIEATISFLKRVFGLARCTWSGLRSFKAYVVSSVLACNLLTVARHRLKAAA